MKKANEKHKRITADELPHVRIAVHNFRNQSFGFPGPIDIQQVPMAQEFQHIRERLDPMGAGFTERIGRPITADLFSAHFSRVGKTVPVNPFSGVSPAEYPVFPAVMVSKDDIIC